LVLLACFQYSWPAASEVKHARPITAARNRGYEAILRVSPKGARAGVEAFARRFRENKLSTF